MQSLGLHPALESEAAGELGPQVSPVHVRVCKALLSGARAGSGAYSAQTWLCQLLAVRDESVS